MKARLKLAAYLAQVRRAVGNRPVEWDFAQLAINHARRVLHGHSTAVRLPPGLTCQAYDASEDLRANAPFAAEWKII